MFGSETRFANDFAKSSVAGTLREAGFDDVSSFDNGVLVFGADASDVRSELDLNPANVKQDGNDVTVFV